MAKKSGFLLGALIGAAAGLLLAPKKGSELREDAGKIYDDFKENPQETLENLKTTTVDFSADKFNDIKAKFDSGEISADKAKEFLVSKRDQIKEKVDSGELSKESVIEFFNDTRDAIVEKINAAKAGTEELFDEEESDISDDLADTVAELNDKKDELVSQVKDQVEEKIDEIDVEKLKAEAEEAADKVKELTSEE